MTVKVAFIDQIDVEIFDGDRTIEDTDFIRVFKDDKHIATVNPKTVRWVKVVE